LSSQAQGKRSPHDLPDLLSGRGLTHEGAGIIHPKNISFIGATMYTVQ
jgi:hypothetical protein